jgi:predicted XRE-type DNA-binding protein
MNPYKIDSGKLRESKKVTDKKLLLKYQLCSAFNELSKDMDTKDILTLTGLHKSDLSRIKVMNVDRFSIDRIVGILDSLGFSMSLRIKPKKAS